MLKIVCFFQIWLTDVNICGLVELHELLELDGLLHIICLGVRFPIINRERVELGLQARVGNIWQDPVLSQPLQGLLHPHYTYAYETQLKMTRWK